jgi:hypothetical protein
MSLSPMLALRVLQTAVKSPVFSHGQHAHQAGDAPPCQAVPASALPGDHWIFVAGSYKSSMQPGALWVYGQASFLVRTNWAYVGSGHDKVYALALP